MADQFNDSIPAVTNQITEDVADIAESLGFLKDVFQAQSNLWSNTVATNIKPKIMGDADNDTLIQCEESADEDIIRFDIGGTETATLTSAGFTVLGVAQGNDVTAAIHRKIVNIGDWNMEATVTLNVAHGLTSSKIRNVSGVIMDDDDGAITYSPLTPAYSAVTGIAQIISWGDTNILLARVTGSAYDDNSYNKTSYNRGWLIIDYVS